MKCPKLVHHRPIPSGWEEAFFGDCIKEECAWWVDGEEGCLFVFIEKDLAGIWTLLTTIANKMPKDLAPGR